MATASPVIKYDLNRDVHTVQEMASRLDPFVYDSEMYGFMPDGLPKLTIGSLLMRLHRLLLLGNLLSGEQRKLLDMARQQLDKVKHEWLTAYTNKTLLELTLRTNETNQFLKECGEDRDKCREMYPAVAEKHVMAQILANEARELNVLTVETENRLRKIDSQLQHTFKPGSFIWDLRLQPAYPQDENGFLYVSI